MPASAVGDDDELEIGGIVVELQMGPRIALADFGFQSRRSDDRRRDVLRKDQGGGEKNDRHAGQTKTLHKGTSAGDFPQSVAWRASVGSKLMKKFAGKLASVAT